LCRFACGSSRNEREESLFLLGANEIFRMRVEPRSIAPRNVQQQQFGSEREGRNIGVA
jgi:hypothetical protein